jgi:serine/threonine-protein kinase
MNCLRPLDEGAACPHCGFARGFVQDSPGLPIRTLIGGRYTVGRMLETGGDGISYVAWDGVRGCAVRLREFFPDPIARRGFDGVLVQPLPGFEYAYATCLDSFQALWGKLEQMRGFSALLPVTELLRENGTVYAVQESIEASTLREYLLLNSVTGNLPAEDALRLLAPLLPALATLHNNGILHLGLSPSGILVTKERRTLLTGFCIWQARTAGGGLRSELYPGYAAPEQYSLSERQGPWTDVYAMAGLYYRALVGSDPIEATLRIRNDRMMIPGRLAEQLPAYVVNALTNALEVNPQGRTENIERFRAELNAAPDAVWAGAVPQAKLVQEEAYEEETPKSNKNNSKRLVLKAALITMLVCLCTMMILGMTVFKTQLQEIFWPPSATGPQTPETTEPLPGTLFEVPDFSAAVGESFTSYKDILSNAVYNQQFDFETKFEYSDTVEADDVISQSVPAGQLVPYGTLITLTVSKGKEMITVPAYIDYVISDMQPILEEKGFVIHIIEEPNDGSHVAGQITSGNLTEGQQYPKGEELFLHVYAQPPTEEPTTTEETTSSAQDTTDLFPWWPF